MFYGTFKVLRPPAFFENPFLKVPIMAVYSTQTNLAFFFSIDVKHAWQATF